MKKTEIFEITMKGGKDLKIIAIVPSKDYQSYFVTVECDEITLCLEDLDISSKTMLALKHQGIDTIGKLLAANIFDMQQHKYFGVRVKEELISELDKYNLKLQRKFTDGIPADTKLSALCKGERQGIKDIIKSLHSMTYGEYIKKDRFSYDQLGGDWKKVQAIDAFLEECKRSM